MPELILHIGTPKTASSYIQACLKNSSEFLQSKGINFPTAFLPHDYTFYPIFYDSPIENYFAWKIHHSYHEALQQKAHYRKLWKSAFEDNKSQTFIISSEGLSLLGLDKIVRIKTFVERHFRRVKILVFFREIEDYHSSMIHEKIKSGFYLDSQEMATVNIAECSFSNMLHNWASVFNSSSLHVIKYAPTTPVLELFFNALGRPELTQAVSLPDRINERLGEYGTAFLNCLNKRFPLFTEGKLNKNRGLHKLGVPEFLFKIPDDRPFKVYPRLSERETKTLNRQIQNVNSYLRDSKLSFLSPNFESRIVTIDKVPETALAHLINNYNIHLDSLLAKQ